MPLYPYHDETLTFPMTSPLATLDDANPRPLHPQQQRRQPWPIPSADVMQERWRYRTNILNETKNQLLVHPHEGLSDTGRNILFCLYDRERHGPRKVTTPIEWKRCRRRLTSTEGESASFMPSNGGACDELEHKGASGSSSNNSINQIGYQSPSTVLESPSQRELRVSRHSGSTTGMPMDEALFSSTETVEHLYDDAMDVATVDETNGTSKEEEAKLSLRRVTYPLTIGRELRAYGEYCSATKYHSSYLTFLGGNDELDAEGNRPPSSRAVSTISVAFSPDGHVMASTHGDHTVKITCSSTGRLLQTLEGHPRTPWTVKFHPTDVRLLASGCLGQQVRVWNWTKKACLQMIRLENAIISLSFHPSGSVLAIANGTRLHFWGIDTIEAESTTASSASTTGIHSMHHATSAAALTAVSLARESVIRSPPTHQRQAHTTTTSTGVRRTERLTEWDQRHMLRCVHFPPNGTTLIIGGVNPVPDDSRRRRNNGGISFYLRLWDFDLEKALDPENDATSVTLSSATPISISMARRSISNPRTFVPRALLYNDGGFDLSADGKTLCACAEYWLPDGVDNAMELLHERELAYESEMQQMEKLPANNETCGLSSISSVYPNSLSDASRVPDLNESSQGRSRSLRDSDTNVLQLNGLLPSTPVAGSPEGHAIFPPSLMYGGGFIPRTPPVSLEPRLRNLSPPPPPGSRFVGRGVMRTREVRTCGGQFMPTGTTGAAVDVVTGQAHPMILNRGNPPPQPPPPAGMTMRPPHPLSVISSSATPESSNQMSDFYVMKGRYVPHLVTVSLDTSSVPEEARDASIARGKPPGAVALGYRPRLGQLMEAFPLDPSKASAVTCVKFSPSTDYCLIGYGVREAVAEGGGNYHPVTAVYRVRGGMDHVSTMFSADDDVNIARFHPDSGHSFIYGTKQGRLRVLSRRPWSFYGAN